LHPVWQKPVARFPGLIRTEPFVEVDADLNKYDTHWLDLIGRIQPGTNPASIEAEMRVGLKQWLRSHWGEMSANDRAKLPNQRCT
jgi:hypothetical protein